MILKNQRLFDNDFGGAHSSGSCTLRWNNLNHSQAPFSRHSQGSFYQRLLRALDTHSNNFNMSSTPLQFISQGTAGKRPGGSDRRLIRAHVMKGKNAGRPRPSTKKATAIVQIKHPFTATRIPTTAYPQPAPKAGRPLLWNDLCLTTFPGQLDSESTKLMHRCTSISKSSTLPCHITLGLHSLTYSQGFLILAMSYFRLNFAPNSI